MDAKQFLKEAREQYSEKDFTKHEWSCNFREDNSSPLEGFKRLLGSYTGRSGHTINYLMAILHVRTLTERFSVPDTEGLCDKEVRDALAKIDYTGMSMYERWDKDEEVLLGLVLDHFDEIIRRMRQISAEYKAIDAMNDELRQHSTLTCCCNFGDIMTEVISLYKQVINAQDDIDTFKKMTDLCKVIHNEKPSLVNMIQSCIDECTKVLGDIESRTGNYETHLHDVFNDILKGTYVYCDSDDVHCVKYMRIDGVKLKKYGDDMELLLYGDILGFDWCGGPLFEPDTYMFVSYMSKLEKGLENLHFIGFDELCKLVEKHVPFMLPYIQKLGE